MTTVIWKPTFSIHPEDISVEEGSTATFECAATGFPRPKITWLKNSTLLPNLTLIEKGSISYLVLRSVTKEQNYGMYRCDATNLAGRTPSKTGMLTVKSVTRIPTVSTFPHGGKNGFRCRFAN